MNIKRPSQTKATVNAATPNGITTNNAVVVGNVGKSSIPIPSAQTRAALTQKIFGSHKPEVIPSAPNITSIPKPPKKTAPVNNDPVVPTEKSVTSSTTSPIVKSRKRTSLEEFAHRKHIRPEIKAGFKAWLRGQNFAFDNEWEQLFIDYNNRKI